MNVVSIVAPTHVRISALYSTFTFEAMACDIFPSSYSLLSRHAISVIACGAQESFVHSPAGQQDLEMNQLMGLSAEHWKL